ncbi:MAG: hypothetical protein ACYS0F_07770 [Planctomycetota bacterium]|jgi:hypothetical protein
MSSQINPEYRLRNLQRRLRDMLMGHRLAADPENTGVVELGDFGKKCDTLAEFAAESVGELNAVCGSEARCAARISEEIELAARLVARLEELPRNKKRVYRQCDLLEEPARMLQGALDAELLQEEEDVRIGLGALAKEERKNFEPFFAFEGKIATPPPSPVPYLALRRALRRALLDHEAGAFHLAVFADGRIEFGDQSFDGEAPAGDLPRAGNEPPEAKQALDMFEGSGDEALKDFLLVKAVDAAVQTLVAPQLGSNEWLNAARALPQRPGKRQSVRPESVRRPVEGWDENDAARAADKLATKRAGPEWARLPKAAYPWHLFGNLEAALAADLIALGPPLRAMEKGESVEGVRERALRAWSSLAGLL